MAKNRVSLRGEFPPDLLRWVTSPEEEVTEEIERVIHRVLRDRKRRVQVFLTALARRQIERIVFLISQLPVVEKELFRKNRIGVAKTGDLIRLLSVVGAQVSDASEFLRQFVSNDELKTDTPPPPEAKVIDVEEVGEGDKEAAKDLSLESRRRLGRVLKKVLNTIDVVEREEAAKKLPEPKG